jgi:tRNA threonylcarbamoyladenosine biosynthesis protein TsaB
MQSRVSIAIETSCRAGEVALGVDGKLLATRPLGPSGRHAAELLAQLDELLRAYDRMPTDVDELYVSAGPGSFTGLRVGVTAARIWAQLRKDMRIVAVPTALAVAENLASLPWDHLGVLLAARGPVGPDEQSTVHGTLIARDDLGRPVIRAPGLADRLADHLAAWPRPLLLSGEGLNFCDLEPVDGVETAPADLRFPTAESVWRVARRWAKTGRFTLWAQLQPLYARRPEALRLWEQKNPPP